MDMEASWFHNPWFQIKTTFQIMFLECSIFYAKHVLCSGVLLYFCPKNTFLEVPVFVSQANLSFSRRREQNFSSSIPCLPQKICLLLLINSYHYISRGLLQIYGDFFFLAICNLLTEGFLRTVRPRHSGSGLNAVHLYIKF